MTLSHKPQKQLGGGSYSTELAHVWSLLPAPWVFEKVSYQATTLQVPQVPQLWGGNSVYQVQEPWLTRAPEKLILVTVTRDGVFVLTV